MEAIKGIFDGENIIATEQIPTNRKFKVIITFVEEIGEKDSNFIEENRNFTAETEGLSFWQDEREDIYQDYLKKD